MVDHVLEIPLPGRTLCAATAEGGASARRFALPAFVAGPENGLLASAVAALLPRDADESPTAAPPVFAIAGASGTGKTHLARGLVRSWQESYGTESAEYLAATDFRRTLREAIDANTVHQFRDRLRSRRLVAIDDLDNLPNDPYLQQELRYTIDAIHENDGTIIVTSAVAIGALRNLSADVRSRLMSGLTLRLAPPEKAARQRMVRHISAALGRPLSDSATKRLAAGVEGTANDVVGALFELNADTTHCPTRADCDEQDEQTVERYLATRGTRRPTLAAISRVVGKHFGVAQKVLKSSSRRQSDVLARAMVVYLARELAGTSYQRIGAALGGRDHTTMLHNYQKIAKLLAQDATTRDTVDQLRSTLQFGGG